MLKSDWPQLIAAVQALGLKVIEVNQPLGRVVVEIPTLEER
jgi:hypothetical protein